MGISKDQSRSGAIMSEVISFQGKSSRVLGYTIRWLKCMAILYLRTYFSEIFQEPLFKSSFSKVLRRGSLNLRISFSVYFTVIWLLCLYRCFLQHCPLMLSSWKYHKHSHFLWIQSTCHSNYIYSFIKSQVTYRTCLQSKYRLYEIRPTGPARRLATR